MRHLFRKMAGLAGGGNDADCRELAALLLRAADDLAAGDALAVEAILARQAPGQRGALLQRAAALAAASNTVRHKIATPANLH